MIFEDIKKDIQTLNELAREFKVAHQDSMFVTNGADLSGFISRMSSYAETAVRVSFQIKTKLKILDEENMYSKLQPGCGEGTADERMRTPMTLYLKETLKKRLSEFQAMKEYIQHESRELIRRRVFAVSGNWPNDEEIDLMEAGGSIYNTQIEILHGGAGQVPAIFAEIQERQEAVTELSKQIIKLAQVFMELVASDNQGQDEMQDDIAKQVTRAVEYSP